ncbi:MAG: DMT family transporter [Dehalococcoidia bacterium]
MNGSAVAMAMVFAAGLSMGLQVVINAALARRIGVPQTGSFSAFITSMLLLALVAVLSRQSPTTVLNAVRQPPWLLTGGFAGALVLSAIAFAPPRIGSLATIALLLAGQLLMGTLLDAFGLFGITRVGLPPGRIAGLLLLAAGAALILRRA